MTLIDTVDIHGFAGSAPALDSASGFGAAEELLGRVLAETLGLRDGIVLATKGGIIPPAPYDSSANSLRAAYEASLQRLRFAKASTSTRYTDLICSPIPREVAGVLDELVKSGIVRALGVPNHTVAETRVLQAWLWTTLATSQPEFAPLALDGRLTINIISSDLPGMQLASDPRDARTLELMTILRTILARSPINHHGKFYDVTLDAPVSPSIGQPSAGWEGCR